MTVGRAVLTLVAQLDAEEVAELRELLGLNNPTATAPPERLLTVAEAADRLSLAQETVRRSVRDGRLAARKLGGAWRIDPTDLTTWGASPTREGRGTGRTAPPRRGHGQRRVMADALRSQEGGVM
jgi:excisionase family DNA binding protein